MIPDGYGDDVKELARTTPLSPKESHFLLYECKLTKLQILVLVKGAATAGLPAYQVCYDYAKSVWRRNQ